ncbi:MAG: amidohydrolase family protein [Acidobacteriota bacterium]|nr:amidohydrolase family protein [Acidobacteriota bacterium]
MNRKSSRLFWVWVFVLGSCSGYAQSPQPVTSLENLPSEVLAYPEIILFNGKVLTVDDEFSMAQAVAIRDGRFLAVGEDARILKMTGPETLTHDLERKTVVPGLLDTHYHLGDYVFRHMLLEENQVQWEGKVELLGLLWKDSDEVLRDIKRAAEAANPGDLVRVPSRNAVIVGNVTRSELDSVSPDNPVVVVAAAQLRPVALNTKALEWAALPSDTPGMPADGRVVISDRASRLLAEHVIDAMPAEKALLWHKKTMSLVNSWGLTMAVTRITVDQFNSLREIWLDDELTVRWRVGFPGPVDFPNTGNLSDIGDDWLRIAGAGGGMAVPGSDGAMDHWTTKIPASADELAGWPQRRREILEALQYGWSTPNSHIKGNIAVRAVLDLIEEAQQNPLVKSSNQRFTMDHMMEIDDRDIVRIKQLGVIPSSSLKNVFSDLHGEGSSVYQEVFGADYVNQMLPLKKYLDLGIRPTVEADMGDEALGKPLWTVEKAICRCVDGSDRIWGREQKVSRRDALRMKTIWAAAYVGDEKKLGSIETGKLADLVVLDGDYMSVPEDQISELEVTLTIVGGRVVYEKADN